MRTPFLITGAPRSGTRFLAAALTSYGAELGVSHEMMGRHGMVSSLAAVDDFFYLGKNVKRTSELGIVATLHMVRHPLKTIASLAHNMGDHFWHWQQWHTSVPGDLQPVLQRCAMFWSRWQRIVEERSPEWRFRLEDIDTVWPEVLDRLGLPQGQRQAVSADFHRTGAAPLSWVALKSACAPDEYARVVERAHAYGYE